MSVMNSYNEIFHKALAILAKYNLDVFASGFDSELLQLLSRNHLDLIRSAESYDDAVNVLGDAMMKHVQLGVAIKLDDFITSINDRDDLYAAYQAWRKLLLAEG